MEKQNKGLISEFLEKNLNVYSGCRQPLFLLGESKDFCKILDIRWKGDIHFEVEASNGYGWYFVSRNHQSLSNLYHFRKMDTTTIIGMQRLINDIEKGRYYNKKTLKEQITEVVEKRGLTGYMNTTKWKELLKEIETTLREIPFMYKTLFEEEDPKYFWSLAGDEYILHIDTAVIEWMKLNPVYKKQEHQGLLLEDKIYVYNLESELISILDNYHIPYEYREEEKVYMIYGYR